MSCGREAALGGRKLGGWVLVRGEGHGLPKWALFKLLPI